MAMWTTEQHTEKKQTFIQILNYFYTDVFSKRAGSIFGALPISQDLPVENGKHSHVLSLMQLPYWPQEQFAENC